MTTNELNTELAHVKAEISDLLARKYDLERQIMHQENDVFRQAFFRWNVSSGNYLFLAPKDYNKELITYYIDSVVLSHNVCNVRKSIYRYACEEYTLDCSNQNLYFNTLAKLEETYNIYVIEESEYDRVNFEFTKLNIENSNVDKFIKNVKYLHKIS